MFWSRKQRRQREVSRNQVHIQQAANAEGQAKPDWMVQRDINVRRMNAALRKNRGNNGSQ